MRGERRSASLRKEKPAGLSRALSWLSVSTLSRQSRRIFHSQNDLHAAHRRQPHSHSHTHLNAAGRAEGDDDDDWVYQPQHKRDPRSDPCADNLSKACRTSAEF
ncbi:NHS-like protein 1 [Liparis tanakae]|uniref:NHS-like protein 1 n=1 Tax=Liparis tanakae TaxID=230148 RepID=A0A4Z2HSA5_9TELE|nr:NHS-like protein 1 [Liparis tanakae]